MSTQLWRVLLYCPLLAVLSFHTIWTESIIFTMFLLPCSLHGHRDARQAQSRQEAGPSSKEGKGLFMSAAMHVLNYYFKCANKDFKFPISIQIFKTFISNLKDHLQLAVHRLYFTVLRQLVYTGFFPAILH